MNCLDVHEGVSCAKSKTSIGHWVSSVQVDDSDQFLAVGGGDKYMGVWHVGSASLLTAVPTNFAIQTCTFFGTTQVLFGGDSREVVRSNMEGQVLGRLEMADKKKARSVWDLKLNKNNLICAGDQFVQIFTGISEGFNNSYFEIEDL